MGGFSMEAKNELCFEKSEHNNAFSIPKGSIIFLRQVEKKVTEIQWVKNRLEKQSEIIKSPKNLVINFLLVLQQKSA